MATIQDRVLSFLDGTRTPQATLIRNALVGIGILWSTKQAFNFLSLINLYLLRSSSLKRYAATSPKDSSTSWALVTGASDGIGKGFAEELLSRGFNVVIHGRNERKLQGVKDDLLKRWPARQVRILVLDAAAAASDANALARAAQEMSGLNLRVLINNVGGNGSVTPLWAPLAERSNSDIGEWIDVNARFPTEITRVLLPQLIRNKPALVLNVGSAASIVPCPYLTQYAGAKAYLNSWSNSMRAEMMAENHDVEFIYIQVGVVATESSKRTPSFMEPTSRQMAKGALARVGCGDSAWGHWPHGVQIGFLFIFPQWLRDKLLTSIAMKEKRHYEAMDKAKLQ